MKKPYKVKKYHWYQKFGAQYKISEVLKKYDLVNLIRSGAPEDEYESEVRMLYTLMRANEKYSIERYSEQDVQLLIKSVFIHMFNEKIYSYVDQAKVVAMSKEIVKEYYSLATIVYEKLIGLLK